MHSHLRAMLLFASAVLLLSSTCLGALDETHDTKVLDAYQRSARPNAPRSSWPWSMFESSRPQEDIDHLCLLEVEDNGKHGLNCDFPLVPLRVSRRSGDLNPKDGESKVDRRVVNLWFGPRLGRRSVKESSVQPKGAGKAWEQYLSRQEEREGQTALGELGGSRGLGKGPKRNGASPGGGLWFGPRLGKRRESSEPFYQPFEASDE